MKRNLFNEPLPSNAAEIAAALDELDLFPRHAVAEIYEPDERDAPPFDGWCASITDAETGEKGFNTIAFPTRRALEDALREAGIGLIEEGW